jgi:hypothetical protein
VVDRRFGDNQSGRRGEADEAYSLDGACTNWAEEPHAGEASWREDCRRLSNGEQVNRVAGLAMVSKRSVDFCGYWQRHLS